MDPPPGGATVRRSSRLQAMKSENRQLENPERTPKKSNDSKVASAHSSEKIDPRKMKMKHQSLKKMIPREERSKQKDSSSDSSDENEYNGVSHSFVLEGRPHKEETVEITKYECAIATRYSRLTEHATSIQAQCSSSSTFCHWWYWCVGLLLVPLVSWVLFRFVAHQGESPDLQRLFPMQSKQLWGFVSYGKNSTEPFVLLLVHGNQENLSSCLAKHVAETVAHSRTGKGHATMLSGSDVSRSSLVSLRKQIEEGNALVLTSIEHINTDAADYLHFVLDVHEPWVDRGVYVLTINIPNINVSKRNAFEDVQTFLTNKWSGEIKEDSLSALILRIGNFEYVVQEDNNPCT